LENSTNDDELALTLNGMKKKFKQIDFTTPFHALKLDKFVPMRICTINKAFNQSVKIIVQTLPTSQGFL